MGNVKRKRALLRTCLPGDDAQDVYAQEESFTFQHKWHPLVEADGRFAWWKRAGAEADETENPH